MAGTVHAEIERLGQLCGGGRWLDAVLLIVGDLGAERLRRAFDVLGVEADAGERGEQLGAFLEAHQGSDLGDHVQDARRQAVAGLTGIRQR